MRGLITCLAFVVFFQFGAVGQSLPLNYDTLELNQEFIVEGGGDFIGSAIQRELSGKFLFGGYIDNSIKDNSYHRHSTINRIGTYGGVHFEYRNYKKKLIENKNWGYLIKAGADVFGGGVYSKDLFGLVFYGNDPYKGETIDFSGSNFSFMSYQKLGFGMIDSKSKSAISINLYNINSSLSANFKSGEITQDLNGDQLDFVLDGEVTLPTNGAFSQGVGIGLDFDFKLPVSIFKGQTSYIQLQAKNIGIGYLHEKQKVYSIDTTLTFSGFQFEQLIGTNAIFSDSLNVLDSLGINSVEKNNVVLLPGYFQVGKIVAKNTGKKLQSFYGVRIYPTLIFKPYVYAGVHYSLSKSICFGLNGGYGGFGKFRVGAYSSCNFGKYSVGVASENVLGFITKKASGQSLFIRLRCAI
ncbi:MAG: hypothetical protein P8N52_05980 [Crocinitomicaceae bacterium]|nr:hypothetical protein [Crocinitomicaceae bacterium]MDG1775964.1 hypothetical protein [Crocinitomicaceae bacterium]